MSYMFSGCSSLSSINLSNFKTVALRNMNHIFRGCSSLTYIDISSFYLKDFDIIFGPFYGLPSNGTILLDSNISDIIIKELPENWTIIYK